MNQEHDSPFHFTFRQPEHAASWLRSVLPKALAEAIDWRSLRRRDRSDGLRSRQADLLFEVALRSRPLLIYVLSKHQGGDDRFTVLQLLGDVVGTWQQFRADHAAAASLPPVLPVVLHHGPRCFRAPREILPLVDLHGQPLEQSRILVPLQANLHFVLDDLGNCTESSLQRRDSTALVRATLLFLQFLRDRSAAEVALALRRWVGLFELVRAAPGGRAAASALVSCALASIQQLTREVREALLLVDPSAEQTIMTWTERLSGG